MGIMKAALFNQTFTLQEGVELGNFIAGESRTFIVFRHPSVCFGLGCSFSLCGVFKA
jgi:hypothetical protein